MLEVIKQLKSYFKSYAMNALNGCKMRKPTVAYIFNFYYYQFCNTCQIVERLQLRLEIEFIYTYLIIRLLRNYTIKCFKMFRYIIKSMITFNIDTNTSALYFQPTHVIKSEDGNITKKATQLAAQ